MAIRQVFRTIVTVWCVALGLAGAICAQAAIVIGGTRVVYDEGQSEVTVKLSNVGTTPSLVQTWIDNGDTQAAPTAINVPFTVMPPISRVDPSKVQTLRIAYTGEPLPQDKESVFWLNVLEVPPKPTGKDASANKMQMAFRSRIKLFFRPSDLKGSPEAAPGLINWRLTDAGGHPAIEAHNPTAYNVSLIAVDVHADKQTATTVDSGMVGPGESKVFPLKGNVTSAIAAKVHYTALNDFGGAMSGDTTVLPSGDAETAR